MSQQATQLLIESDDEECHVESSQVIRERSPFPEREKAKSLDNLSKSNLTIEFNRISSSIVDGLDKCSSFLKM